MAHNSQPMCLTEVCNGIIAYIKNNDITTDGLMEYIKGPDYPLGNVCINQKDIKKAFETGRSDVSLKVRGDYEIDGNKIIFTSIPYRTYRNKIKEQINNNIDSFDSILDDFADESSVGKNRLVFTIKDGIGTKVALNKIFALTDLQTSISYNMNYIVNGTPKLCSLKDLIIAYVNHQINIIIKSAEYDKEKAENRKHILDGLLIAIGDIDKAIELIRQSNDKNEAVIALTSYFSIDEIQAKAILDMKLSKLTKLDKSDLEKELIEKIAIIKEMNLLIKDSDYRNNNLIGKIEAMRDKYGDERRTKLINLETPKGEDKEIVNVEPEKCAVLMTDSGLIKRIPLTSFKTQRRAGKGIKTNDDITNCIIRTNTIDNLMIFSDKGKMYRMLVDNIPVGNNTSKGQYIKSLIEMDPDENPVIMYSIYRDTEAKYVMFITKNGLAKKTSLEEYLKMRKRTGVAAISLNDGDSIASVFLVKDENIIILTKNGNGIQIKSTDIPTAGRTTKGIKGITLKDGDEVLTALPIHNISDNLALFHKNGTGFKISLKDLPLQNRAGKGLSCSKEEIVAAALVENSDRVLIVGTKSSICIEASEIPVLSRGAGGNQLLKGIIEKVSKI